MKPFAWSHSALEDYKNCPRSYHAKKVIKIVKEERGEEALWGDYVHKSIEKYLKREAALPADLHEYKNIIADVMIRPGKMLVECQYAIDSKLEPCAWFGKDPAPWMRGIIDVCHLHGLDAWVSDWKTGKTKQDDRQLKIFALLIFIHHPFVQEVHTQFIWLKSSLLTPWKTFKRSSIDELWSELVPDLTQFAKSFQNDTWPPRVSGLCKGWCPVKQCEFWQERTVR